jgi:hypothetical protein
MEKLTVRKPAPVDLGAALQDLASLRAAPPLLISAALIVLLTGNILVALLTVGLTSYVHALWTRLVHETSVVDGPRA